jgi:SAM-dependent methyltransferase
MYETIASYYDLIHADLTDDIDFVIRMGSDIKGRVLELGCGTGRLLIPLARVGHIVTGLDSSRVMLAEAERKITTIRDESQNRINLVEADMIQFELNTIFNFAIYGHNTFMHVAKKDVESALQCLRRHLSSGSPLLIDVDNPNEVADPEIDHLLVFERSLTFPQSKDILVQTASSWVDPEEQVRQTTWIFDRSPAGGGSVTRNVVESSFHYYFPHQIELAMNSTGFELQNLYGDYDRSPYKSQSQRMLVIGKAI